MAAITQAQIASVVAIRRQLADRDREAAGALSKQVPSRFLHLVFGEFPPNDRVLPLDWSDIEISLANFNALRPATPYSQQAWKKFYTHFEGSLYLPGGGREFGVFLRENREDMRLPWGKLLTANFRQNRYEAAELILRARGVEPLVLADFETFVSTEQRYSEVALCVQRALGTSGVMRLVELVLPLCIDSGINKNRRDRLVQQIDACFEVSAVPLDIEYKVSAVEE